MESNPTTIRITPDNRQYLVDNWYDILLLVLSLMGTGCDNRTAQVFSLVLSVFFTAILIYEYWFLTSVRWDVTRQHIVYVRGIFNRSTDYVELYRIVDYKEEQNLLQQLFGIKTLTVYSGDRSHPSLNIYGLEEDSRIVDFIRNNVEIQKQKKKIYEITNR